MSRNYLKEAYIEAREANKDQKLDSRFVYTADQLHALKEMARADVYPDGRFSDEECVIWGWFHIGKGS